MPGRVRTSVRPNAPQLDPRDVQLAGELELASLKTLVKAHPTVVGKGLERIDDWLFGG